MDRGIARVPPDVRIDVTDGSLDDWRAVLPTPTLTTQDFQIHNFGEVKDQVEPSDLDVSIWLLWDDEPPALYVAVERFDDVLLPYPPLSAIESVWMYDGFEILIDGDGNGGRYGPPPYAECGISVEEAIETENWFCIPDRYDYNRTAQQYLATIDENTEPVIAIGGHKEWLVPTIESGVTRNLLPDGRSRVLFEVAVTPYDELDFRGESFSRRSVFAPGKTIGLDIALADFDTAPGRYRSFHNISGNADAWIDADLMPRFVLQESVATSIGEQTWGTLKIRQ